MSRVPTTYQYSRVQYSEWVDKTNIEFCISLYGEQILV